MIQAALAARWDRYWQKGRSLPDWSPLNFALRTWFFDRNQTAFGVLPPVMPYTFVDHQPDVLAVEAQVYHETGDLV